MRILKKATYIFICTLPPILFCVTGGAWMLPIALAVFLHESAHLAVLLSFGGKLRGFHPAPFGLCMEYDENTLSVGGEIAVCAAGSLVNLLSFLVSLLCYRFFSVDILDFGIISLLMAMFNLLPVQPLDGGRLLSLFLAAWRGPDFACRVSGVLTYCFGFLLFLISSYLLLTAQTGVYPLLFTVFLFSVNARALEAV